MPAPKRASDLLKGRGDELRTRPSMMNRPATAEDFTRWNERALTMTTDALRWSITDALAASQAVDGHDPIRAGYYRDEALTYQSELNGREVVAARKLLDDALANGRAAAAILRATLSNASDYALRTVITARVWDQIRALQHAGLLGDLVVSIDPSANGRMISLLAQSLADAEIARRASKAGA